MRKIILLIAIICYATSATAQKKVSVLGDSYSTFEGFMTPSCNLSWYAGEDGKGKRNDVSRVEETWWHLLIKKQGWTLEANNSYSGATICFTGYRGEDYSDRSFITRMYNLGNPDIILIFGGTLTDRHQQIFRLDTHRSFPVQASFLLSAIINAQTIPASQDYKYH